MQLRYCKPEGAEMILEDWLYRLCHNLLKADNISDAKVEKFVSNLVQIHKGKETKHVIKTYAKRRDWNTLGLFHKTGLAYYYKGELIYESCHVITKIDDKTVKLPMSKADKYGYLFFANHAEAIGYKKAVASENSVKKGVKSIHWHRDTIPRGPRMYRKDLLHLSPAIISDKNTPHSNPELRSASHNEKIDSHSQQAIRLKDSNRRLQLELQVLIEKLHTQEERLRVIEEKLASQQ